MKTIPKNALWFNRSVIALLIWASFVFRVELFLIIVVGLLFLDALLKFSASPLVLLYTHTFAKLFPGGDMNVNEKALRFASSLGVLLSTLCLILVYFLPWIGWWTVLGFAILKTISALGFCPGEALYAMIMNDD